MIHFIEANSGGSINILLLHGLGADANSWSYQFKGLSIRDYRLIAPDIPGFGSSPPYDGRWRLSAATDALVEMMDQLSVSQAIVTGISMGGVIAMDMAVRYPQRVRGLILINTFANLKPASASEWVYFLRRGFRAFFRNPAEQAQLVADRVFPGEERAYFRELLEASILKANPQAYRQAMLELVKVNFTSRLGKIRVPALVISGENDTTIPLKRQKELATGIARARHVIIPKAGHGVIADQPEVFNSCVRGFIEQVRAEVF